jgi:hypothetical protein
VLECKSDCDDYILGETRRTDSREQLGSTQPLNGTMDDAQVGCDGADGLDAVVELSQKLRLCC